MVRPYYKVELLLIVYILSYDKSYDSLSVEAKLQQADKLQQAEA